MLLLLMELKDKWTKKIDFNGQTKEKDPISSFDYRFILLSKSVFSSSFFFSCQIVSHSSSLLHLFFFFFVFILNRMTMFLFQIDLLYTLSHKPTQWIFPIVILFFWPYSSSTIHFNNVTMKDLFSFSHFFSQCYNEVVSRLFDNSHYGKQAHTYIYIYNKIWTYYL
jgi:hypothetical protein